jgi:ABC-type bacteriocin/lantibiotic exporter with double-glycine peptidase domain
VLTLPHNAKELCPEIHIARNPQTKIHIGGQLQNILEFIFSTGEVLAKQGYSRIMQFDLIKNSNFEIVRRSFRILSKAERIRVFGVVGIQILLSFLDLIGIALAGVLGALAISGIGSNGPGNRMTSLLRLFHLEKFTLQEQALIIGISTATILIAKTILSIYFLRRITYFLSRRGAIISARMISRLLSQPLTKLQANSTQETIYFLNTGINAVTMGVLSTSIQMISDFSLLIVLVVGLFVVDPLIAISTLTIFSCVVWLLYRLLQVKSKQLGIIDAQLNIENSEKTLEVLNSYREIVVRNRRNYYSRQIGEIRLKAADNAAERTFLPNISKYAIELTLVVGTLAISAAQFATNTAAHAAAVLSVFIAASTRIAPAVLRLQQGALSMVTRAGSAEPALNLIEELQNVDPLEIVDDHIDFDHVGFSPEIVLKELSFSYPGATEPVIQKVNLNVEAGKFVAFVGPSGAGKSTLIDLILGIYEPESGQVLVNKIPPLEAIARWPGAIGYVPQQIQFSNGSICSNIGMGFPAQTVPEDRVLTAIRTAQLESFVSSLEQGIQTQIGDGASGISGGQKQRLGIARALFTNPSLLILDEATSALDGETEAAFANSILALKGKITVVIIAHRLSTVREADLVCYMESGRIVAAGTFNEVRNMVPDFDRQASVMGL